MSIPPSREKHTVTHTNLLQMIADLETTVSKGEMIGTVQAEAAIEVLRNARKDLERCTHNPHIMMVYSPIAENYILTHSDLIGWINSLSIDLKLMNIYRERGDDVQLPEDMAAQLAEGKTRLGELYSCRESQLLF